MAYVAPRRQKSESVTESITNRQTDQRTDTRSYRVAWSRLKLSTSQFRWQNLPPPIYPRKRAQLPVSSRQRFHRRPQTPSQLRGFRRNEKRREASSGAPEGRETRVRPVRRAKAAACSPESLCPAFSPETADLSEMKEEESFRA